MAIEDFAVTGRIGGLEELPERVRSEPSVGTEFGQALKDAVRNVDELQKDSAGVQAAWAEGREVDLHDVLIKIEEADIAFRAMMEVRTKLVEAYREVMRLGSGG